ncbi:MAG TPA: acyltransferase family protein [Solirubrobacterales bacterium]
MRPRQERLHHLDALRALTMVLILPAHALALIGLQSGWNSLEAATFWTIHVFRLPLFFLIAGFFAALLLETRGPGGLVRNRTIRIGVPLLLGVALVVPVLNVCLFEASAQPNRSAGGALDTLTQVQPSYLWFLWYLVLLYAIALPAQRLVGRRPAAASLHRTGSKLLGHPLAPLLLAVPTGLLLYRQPAWIAGSSHTQTFAPAPDLLAYYGLFFFSGWALFAVPGLRSSIESRPGIYSLLAGLALPPALAFYLLHSQPAIGASRAFHLLALLLLSISTWSIAFALLGLSRRHLSDENPRLRAWADSSYWIYLSHFVPMAALAALLVGIAMPGTLRAALLVAITFALVYPAYWAFVRYTFLGRVLHGPRIRPRADRLPPTRQPVVAAPPA